MMLHSVEFIRRRRHNFMILCNCMSYTTTPTLSTISFQILFVTIYQYNASLNCGTSTHYQGRQAQIIQWSPKQMQSNLQVNCFLTNKMSTQTQLSLIPKLKFNYGNVTNMIRILRSGQISICYSWYQKSMIEFLRSSSWIKSLHTDGTTIKGIDEKMTQYLS